MDQPTVEPLITVVLPVRDRADLLPRTLRSIQHQTLRPLRVVIADNGSTDAAPRIIAEWKERVAPEGISVKIVSEPRPGAARAHTDVLLPTIWHRSTHGCANTPTPTCCGGMSASSTMTAGRH